MCSDSDVFAAYDRKKSDGRVIAYLDPISANDGAESDGNSLADPIPSKSVEPCFDEPRPQPEEENLPNGDARLFN